MMPNATQTTTMIHVENAAACDVSPASSSRIIVTAATSSFGVVKKTTADKVTIDRIKRKKNTATSIGATNGATMLTAVRPMPAPNVFAASSSVSGN